MTKEHEEIYNRLLRRRMSRADVEKAALHEQIKAVDRALDAYDCGLVCAIREIEEAESKNNENGRNNEKNYSTDA